MIKLRYTEHCNCTKNHENIKKRIPDENEDVGFFICLGVNCSFLLFLTCVWLNLNAPVICLIYGSENLVVWSLVQPVSSDRKGNSSVRFFSTSGCNCHQCVFSFNEAFSTLS